MKDLLLTILGCCIYIPWFVQTARTPWKRTDWSRQWLLAMLSLTGITILHIPSVMYICAGLTALSLAVYILCTKPAFKATPILIISIAYSLWFALSLLWSASPRKGMIFIIDNGLPMVLFALTACVIRMEKEELITLLRTFCRATCIFIGVAVVSWLISCQETHIMPWDWPILRKTDVENRYIYQWVFRFLGGMTNGYAHPSYNLLPIFIAGGIATWLRKEQKEPAPVWWIIWSGGLLLTLLTESRMGIIYSGILLSGYILYLMPSRRWRIGATAVIILAGIIGMAATGDFWRQYGRDDIRHSLYADTWAYIQKKPLTGAGAGALNPIEICHTIGKEYWPHVGYIAPEREVTDWPVKTRMLPHNQWLADWAHGGLLAAILSATLLIFTAMRCLRTRNYWGGIAWVIFVIFSVLEPTLYIGKGLYLFCWLYCLTYTPLIYQTYRADTPV